MNKLPYYIRLVKFKSKNKLIFNTLKEYFDDFPCIVYTDYGLKDNYTYYIVPNTDTICSILYDIRDYLDDVDPSIFIYSYYTYNTKDNRALHTYDINPGAWDADELPPNILIDSNLVDKLKSISECYYD